MPTIYFVWRNLFDFFFVIFCHEVQPCEPITCSGEVVHTSLTDYPLECSTHRLLSKDQDLDGLQWLTTLVYLDNVTVFGKNFKKHLE